jgi:putative membrane protein
MMDWNNGGNWSAWLLMSVMMLLFFGAIVWLVIWLVRGNSSSQDNQDRTGGGARAESVLAERFARGEIDENEYRSRLGVLKGNGSSTPPRLDKSPAGK